MIRTLVVSIAMGGLALAAMPVGAMAYSGGCRIAREGAERLAPSAVPAELAGLVTVRGRTARIAATSQFGNLPITIHVRKPRDCGEMPGAGKIKRR
jgi:hypothetical protein